MSEGQTGPIQPPTPPGTPGKHSSGPAVPGGQAPSGGGGGSSHSGKKPGLFKKLFSRWQVR
jgi:hypothetical protein